MPVLKFSEGDEVIISEADLENGGKSGEIIQYQGIIQMQMPGQIEEQNGEDPWWVVRLQSGSEISVLQSHLSIV